ncbi:MAG: AAA family ATPase [Synechococcus sp. YX04-3]|nr:MAG: AAA family ATPase [Synechococcus sp. YX04-3]
MNHVVVQYPEKPRDKSQQNLDQARLLSEQLKRLKDMRNVEIPDIWFDPVLWMTNYHKKLDPVIGEWAMNADEGLNRLLEIVASNGMILSDGEMFKNCWIKGGNTSISKARKELISLYDLVEEKRTHYGLLTRENIDNICKDNLDTNEKYREQGVDSFLCLEGKPGTGKTVTLLLIAYSLLSEDIDVMFLTYNLALAYDLRQMWWHLKSKNHVAGDLYVRSQYSFFGTLLDKLRKTLGGISGASDKDFYENYEDQYLPFMLNSLKTMSSDQVIKFKRENDFLMQKVLIDEGQDWHSNEVEILEILYGKDRIITAQSDTQLVRTNRNINWHEWLGGSRKDNSYWRMKKNMRMKSNLVDFCNELANNMKTRYKFTSDKAKGGKIKLISGDLSDHANLIEETFVRHEESGCTPYEYLIMTPDTSASTNILRGIRRLQTDDKLINLSRHELRVQFSNSLDIFSQDKVRYVNYQSVRGLEGWTCICLSLDRFWHDLDGWYERIESSMSSDLSGQFQIQTSSPEEKRLQFKFNWLMIALSRAVDQLVLHVDDDQSEIAKIMTECIMSTSR